MELLQPIMLAALGLIPILILLHTLRPKPKQVQVTNLFLWHEILKDRGSNIAFKRLRKNLPLLLQILLIILAALALARPVWLHFVRKEGRVILVVDTSASMQTRVGEESRFERARREALQLLDDHASSQEILVIEAGYEPVLRSGFMQSTPEVREVIRALKPTDAPGKLEKALYLAISFVEPATDDTIYLITDGAGYDFLKLLQIPQRIVPVVVAGGERNVGITKFEFRQQLASSEMYEVMLKVKNFTTEEQTFPLRLSVDNTTIVETELTLTDSEERLFIFPYSGLLTGIARAEIDIDDDFSVDNSASLALSTSKDIWVLLASKGNYFLEKLLEAYPNFLVNTVDEIIPGSWEEHVKGHDLVIVDRMDVPPTDAGNLLLIDSLSPSIPVERNGVVTFPDVLDWDEKHPLMADVNVSGLTIEEAHQLHPNETQGESSERLHPIIEGSQTGLMYTYEKDQLRAVVLGFDITRSDLPLKVAFPVMMSNIINWLNPNKLTFSALQVQAGEPFAIQVERDTTEISVRAPDGEWTKYPVTTRPVVYDNTRAVGTYTVLENKKSRYFTVNLVDEAESDITVPPLDMTSYMAKLATNAEQIATKQHLWAWFLLAGITFLVVEWYVWLKVG